MVKVCCSVQNLSSICQASVCCPNLTTIIDFPNTSYIKYNQGDRRLSQSCQLFFHIFNMDSKGLTKALNDERFSLLNAYLSNFVHFW